MVLFSYICFGALINSLLQKLTFINGLYFTLVSIETIGFGDIVPKTTGARVFVCAYSAIGFLNLGVAIGMCRETVLEGMEVAYRKRARKVKERWKETRERKHIEARWRRSIEWRLKEMGVPVWIRDENWHLHLHRGGGGRSVQRVAIKERTPTMESTDSTGSLDHKHGHSHIMHGPTGMRLNLNALTLAQLEASALEAGGTLDALLPPDLVPAAEETAAHDTDADTGPNLLGWMHHPLASHFEHVFHPTEARTWTHARLGGMSALLTRFAVAAVHRHVTTPDEVLNQDMPTNQNGNSASATIVTGETSDKPQDPPEEDEEHPHLDFSSMVAHTSDNLDLQSMEELDTKAFYSKLLIAWTLFFVFWTVSARLAIPVID
jgi:potassium channel subfamily K, other eukaryote